MLHRIRAGRNEAYKGEVETTLVSETFTDRKSQKQKRRAFLFVTSFVALTTFQWRGVVSLPWRRDPMIGTNVFTATNSTVSSAATTTVAAADSVVSGIAPHSRSPVLCGLQSKCWRTKALLQSRKVTGPPASHILCVEMMSKEGTCFLPLGGNAHDSADHVLQSNYASFAATLFSDVVGELAPGVSGTAVIGLHDKANSVLTDEVMDDLRRSGSPFLAHNMQSSHRNGTYALIPDWHYVNRRGFQGALSDWREDVARPFEERYREVIWRGSTTGQSSFESSTADDGAFGLRDSENDEQCAPRGTCGSLPRLQMVRKGLNITGANIKIWRAVQSCVPCETRLKEGGLVGEAVAESNWAKYRGQVDIAGNANAWGAYKRYRSGSVVLRVEDDWVNFFSHLLEPWVHYIPVRKDSSDLRERVELVTSDRPEDIELLKRMTLAAERALKNVTYESEIARVARELENIWHEASLRQVELTLPQL
jgi:Glycosyl transferase family 90